MIEDVADDLRLDKILDYIRSFAKKPLYTVHAKSTRVLRGSRDFFLSRLKPATHSPVQQHQSPPIPKYTTIMSTPSRQRSSQSATPRRSARNSSQALPSSPTQAFDPAAAQLLGEQASSQDDRAEGTPRGSRQAPNTSSPMFFQSSPAGRNAANPNARDVSSPLRQMTNTQSTNEDRDRTPRASGNTFRGMFAVRIQKSTTN